MKTKSIGIIILAVGLLMTIYTGFNYVTRETVMDMGDVHISMDENHSTNWSPFIGMGIIVIGGVVFVTGSRKNSSG